MTHTGASEATPTPAGRGLILPPLLEAIQAWLDAPGTATEQRLMHALADVASALDLHLERLRVTAPPLPPVDLQFESGTAGAEVALRMPGERAPIGSMRLSGDPDQIASLTRTLELVMGSSHARARADRTQRQLQGLDQAVRGISGVLDLDRVLELIVDRVRDLAEAEYAALGIVSPDGQIERFITSGIAHEARERIGDLPHGRGLLGLIIRENKTYRIPDISTHPERYGFPPHHPAMSSFLGMPIHASGAVVGRLYLTNKLGAVEFSEDDQALVEMFALHAGIAIENARLHDQVRRLAIVDERERISRDLHDSAIQAIYAQTLALDDVPELISDDPVEAGRRVDEAIDALHGVIRDIRNFIFGLRPVLVEAGGLTDGLEHLANELRRNGGVSVSVSTADAVGPLDDLTLETVAELLAVTREALSNIARHASATEASVGVGGGATELTLEIADNGRGFDADARADHGHHGVANMRARTERLGGRFAVHSDPDAGTRIIITLRRRPNAAHGDSA